MVRQLQNCCCYAKSWWTAERYSHLCICISMAWMEKDKALFHTLQWAYTPCCSLQVSFFHSYGSSFNVYWREMVLLYYLINTFDILLVIRLLFLFHYFFKELWRLHVEMFTIRFGGLAGCCFSIPKWMCPEGKQNAIWGGNNFACYV